MAIRMVYGMAQQKCWSAISEQRERERGRAYLVHLKGRHHGIRCGLRGAIQTGNLVVMDRAVHAGPIDKAVVVRPLVQVAAIVQLRLGPPFAFCVVN